MSKLSITILCAIVLNLASCYLPESNDNAKRNLSYPEPVGYDILYAAGNEDQLLSVEGSTMKLRTTVRGGKLRATLDICGRQSFVFTENETLLSVKRISSDSCVDEERRQNFAKARTHDLIFKNIRKEVSMIRFSFFGRDWVVMNLDNINTQDNIMVIGRNQEA